jgi:CubicO group peptidase (beta-lactamase class C family)
MAGTRGEAEVVSRVSTSVGEGFVADGFEGVAETFARNFSELGEIGAAFAAYVDGRLVVDLWGGLADRRGNVAWGRDTLVGIFSGSKGLVATCLLLLLERGQLDLDAPVCRYWPEFAACGKEDVLVRDVVSHQAGLPGLLTPVSVEDATDAARMAQLLAAQRPIAPPGSGPRYHAVTFGWLCGELVRRVDGRSIGQLLRDEIAEPLELDVWIGLPARHEGRVAVLERGAAFGRGPTDLLVEREVDETAWSIYSNPPRWSHGGELAANLRSWRQAEVPATNAIANARSMARLYGCLARGGDIDGVRLLSPETVDRGRHCLARGRDPYVGELAFGTGFQLQSDGGDLGPAPDAFGHTGAGGSVHGAWPGLWTGFSYAPNLLRSLDAGDPRAEALLTALHAAVDVKPRGAPPRRRADVDTRREMEKA